MSMTKKDLKTGMFGVDNDGNYFIVVNNLIVYQNGGFDLLDYVEDDLTLSFRRRIMKLFNCGSFKQAKNDLDIIYDREKEIVNEMTISEIEKALGISNLKIKKESK